MSPPGRKSAKLKHKIHHIKVTAYEKSPEELQKTIKDTRKILPKDCEIKSGEIEPETEGGVFTNRLYSIEATIKNQKDIREFMTKTLGCLDSYDIKKLRTSVEKHVDEACNLYLRLSKQELAQGQIVLESRNPVHVRIKIAAYPAKKENAIPVAREIIEDGIR
jgi:RNA-binding protein